MTNVFIFCSLFGRHNKADREWLHSFILQRKGAVGLILINPLTLYLINLCPIEKRNISELM